MEIRNHIYGHGEEELQFLLFHKLIEDPTIANEGQFYYNTTNELIKIHTSDAWKYIPFVESMVSTKRLATLENGIISQLRQVGGGTSVFLMLDSNDVPASRHKILFDDIISAAICTSITSPGDNITLTTEKAVVDYMESIISEVSTVAGGSSTNIQVNDNDILAGYSTFNYIYSSNTLELSFNGIPNSEFPNILFTLGESYSKLLLGDEGLFTISSDVGMFLTTPENIDIQGDLITLIGDINLYNGTGDKYLYLDSSKNVTFVDGPTGGGTISGTANYIPIFTDRDTIGNSTIVYDGASKYTLTGDLEITGILSRGATPSYSFNPGVANGTSAVAYILNTENTLSNATAKIISILNNNTERMSLLASGQLLLNRYGSNNFVTGTIPSTFLCAHSSGKIIELVIGVSDEFTAGTKTIRVTNGLITEIV